MGRKISIRVNADLPGYISGSVVSVDADEEGTPLSQYWRRRLADAKRDGCCEVVSEPGKDAAGDAANLFETDENDGSDES